ncbi:MAG: hypothetical protein CL572_00665 [Alphaproteobacteria bacterium]|jgi:hypothetical protein|nr:hypothetical protein [Alphaproteobacteria bacterium]
MIGLKLFKRSFLLISSFYLVSCSTLESTFDSTMESISEAGDYIYNTVNFWDDESDEPEQSEAIVIEEAVEVPDYAIPDQNFITQELPQQNIPMPLAQPQPYYDPIYRSARQYYFVGPNGTPLLAPPPPPFPQYSIDQANPVVPYSYYNSLNSISRPQVQNEPIQSLEQPKTKILPKMLSKDEEMELFAIQNDCVRVKEDLVNGGYVCDDFE